MMKVGDLVRHQMYSELKAPAIVLAIDTIDTSHSMFMIKIFDPDDGVAGWCCAKDYEVISESR